MFNQKILELGYTKTIIREVYSESLRRKKEIGEDNVFDFSIGNPSIPSPNIVKDTLIKLLNEEDSIKVHGYTIAAGDMGVRTAISEYLNRTYQASVKGEYIFMTCGASSSLIAIIKALVNEGDEVIVFAPHFPEYRVYSESVGGVVVPVKPDKDFFPDFNDLNSKINDKTKLVIYNSPNNPTGAFYDEITIKRLTEILHKKEIEYNHPIYLLSDEPYRELLYNDEKYPFITNYYNNSLVAYSFSKSLSLPGDRIGYILLNPKCQDVNDVFALICGASRLLGHICAPSMFQLLIPYCLGYTSDLSKYKINRDLLYSSFKDIGYDVIYPTGAFYIFVKALEDDAEAFMRVAKQYELYIVPSDSFEYPGYVRLAYCVSHKTIVNSIPAWKALYDHYKGEKL